MENSYLYFVGIIITLVCCLIVIIFIKRKYYDILVELTGNASRAEFWLAFSNVLLILVPLVFCMSVYPETGDLEQIIFELTRQLWWGLIGLIISLLGLGLVMISFIRKKN